MYLFVQNWKCRTSTEGTLGSLWASSIATLYHPPVGNEELRLSFLLAHCIVNVENKLATLYSMFAHFTRRGFLAECLCTIPAVKALLAFGAGSRKSSLHKSLASAGKSEPFGLIELLTLVKGIGSGLCPSPCFTFSLLACCSKLRATCKSTSRNGWWNLL